MEGAEEVVGGLTLKGLECHTKSVMRERGEKVWTDLLVVAGFSSLEQFQPRLRFMTPTQQHDPEGRGCLMLFGLDALPLVPVKCL